MQSRCRESKCPCAGQSLRVPRAGASGTEASVHVSVCVCVCVTWVCVPVPGRLWGSGVRPTSGQSLLWHFLRALAFFSVKVRTEVSSYHIV